MRSLPLSRHFFEVLSLGLSDSESRRTRSALSSLWPLWGLRDEPYPGEFLIRKTALCDASPRAQSGILVFDFLIQKVSPRCLGVALRLKDSPADFLIQKMRVGGKALKNGSSVESKTGDSVLIKIKE